MPKFLLQLDNGSIISYDKDDDPQSIRIVSQMPGTLNGARVEYEDDGKKVQAEVISSSEGV